MPIQDTNRRLTPLNLRQDIDAYHGLQTINGYTTARTEATPEAIQAAYDVMLAKQREETEKEAIFKAAADVARLAEWEFHNSVLAMKEAVKGQFGSDSNEAAAVGFKKKSERKRPQRKPTESSPTN
jgi:hypothetical protein